MRKTLQIFSFGLTALLLTVTMATASPNDLKTEITVNEQIEIPGHILTPGEYTMALMDNTAPTRVVVFRDSDGEFVASAMAWTAERTDPEGTKFTFYETPANEPPAMRKWFYPGRTIGFEFIYPESRSNKLARYSHRHVPSMTDTDFAKAFQKAHTPDILAVKEVTIYAVSPDQKKVDMKTAESANLEADRRTQDSSRYLVSREMEESRLERQIRKEIVTLPFYSIWDHISFSVNDNGAVTVNGKVYRPSLKKSVERAVGRIEGVTAVDNQLEVLPTSTFDDDIRMATYRRIYGNSALQRYQLRAVPPIHIIVENGHVTLEGVVTSQFDKRLAGSQANTVNGVFDVVNNLRIEG